MSEHDTHARLVKLVKPGVEIPGVFPKVDVRPYNAGPSHQVVGRADDAVCDSLSGLLTEEFPQPVNVIVEENFRVGLVVTMTRAGGGRRRCLRPRHTACMHGHVRKDCEDVGFGHGARPEDVNLVSCNGDYRRLEANLARPTVKVGCRREAKAPTGHLHSRRTGLAGPVGTWRGDRNAGRPNEPLRNRVRRYPNCHRLQTGGDHAWKIPARRQNDRERPGREFSEESACGWADLSRNTAGLVRYGQVDNQRIVGRTAFGLKNGIYGARIKRIRTKPVDGLSWKDNHLAVADVLGRRPYF